MNTMPKRMIREIFCEDFGYGLVEVSTRLVEYNPNPVHIHGEKGQFTSGGGGGGGDGGGGSSGRGGGGSTSATRSKEERERAREEFKFLDKRLAAGNLKRGERASIQRRQERLAKIVFGVNG